MATQRHTVMDYHAVSQGRASVPPAVGGPWYSDNRPSAAQVPQGGTRDTTRSLMLEIPSTSPGGGGLGLRHGERPLSASTQHLLTVATPTPSQTDVSAVNPELRRAQKSGDLYNISVNLNALQLAAQSPSAVSNAASMRRAKSLQDVAANWSFRPLSTTPNDEQEGGTTVVQVRRDDEEQSPQIMSVSMSTLPTTQRKTKPVTRTPSVRTVNIPPSSGRRSRARSASRISGGPDEGYVIKSLQSTSDDVPSGRASSTRLASDGKVVFDVELMRQQQQQQWEMEQSSSQQVLNLTSSGHRSLVIESVRPSTTGGRQQMDPRDLAEPTYTMTMNQQMTMNYEPPLPSPQPPQQDMFDETVHQRASYLTSSGTTRSDAMTASNGYLAVQQQPSADVRKKKKKRPRLVNSATQMAVDKSTQMRQKPKPKVSSDDESVERSKKPTTKSQPKTLEPRMVSSATQMGVDKSTQMRPKPKGSSDDDESVERSKKPTTKSQPKTLEPRMVSKATQMAVNKSTQVTKPKNDDDSEDRATSSDTERQQGRKNAQKPRKKKSPEFGVQVTMPNMIEDRHTTPTFNQLLRKASQDAQRGSRSGRPMNGYHGDSQPLTSEDEIRPQRRDRVEALPDWSDDNEQPDMERRDDRPRQQLTPPGRRPDSCRSQDQQDVYPQRQPECYSPQGQDFPDSGLGPNRRGPYEGGPVNDYIRPSSAHMEHAPQPSHYPRSSSQQMQQAPSDSDDDDMHNSRRYSPYQDDHVDGPRSPDQFPEPHETFDGYRPGIDRSSNCDRMTGQRSDLYPRDVGNRDTADRFTTVAITSSAFDRQDEAYLQRRRLNNTASARRSLQSRPGAATKRSAKDEEAKGRFYHYYIYPLSPVSTTRVDGPS